MTNKQSQDYLAQVTGWRLEAIRDLDESYWTAVATTTHFRARGESEHSFIVVAAGFNHFELDFHALPELTNWCNEQMHTI